MFETKQQSDREDEIKQLYKDAMYYHLLKNGRSTRQAKKEIRNIFSKKTHRNSLPI